MSGFFLEGESYFVLGELNRLITGKNIEINPEKIADISLFNKVDYYVFFDPDKETCEKIKCNNFIICYLDKNVDLRLDYIKKLKTQSEFYSFEPIPTTDCVGLKKIFPKLEINNFIPSKKCPLKYKGSKQSYEWFDICLISDLYDFRSEQVYQKIFDSYFDIWKFTDDLWSSNIKGLSQIQYINDKNFEDYFNRIRETSKDYLELIQTGASNFYTHKKLLPQGVINNEFRFNKIKEKLNILKSNAIDSIGYFDNCLKNVRLGSNPKLELIKLFFDFKRNAG